LKAMPSPYYYYYKRVCVMVKQRNIESDANPVLWNHLKRTHLWCEGLLLWSLLLTTEHRWVTELREGGDVRGSLLQWLWFSKRGLLPR
jgi:hypothetical protein